MWLKEKERQTWKARIETCPSKNVTINKGRHRLHSSSITSSEKKREKVDRVIQITEFVYPSSFVAWLVRLHSPTFTSFIRQATPFSFPFLLPSTVLSTLCFLFVIFGFWTLAFHFHVAFLFSSLHDSVMSYSGLLHVLFFFSFVLCNTRLELSSETGYSSLFII